MKICICLAILIVHAAVGRARCPSSALTSLPFVLEYAVWRGWHQALIFTPDIEKGCQWATVRLMKCLGINGVASATNSLINPRVRTDLGIIILAPQIKRNAAEKLKQLMKKLHELEMDNASYDWLLVARSDYDFRYINKVLNDTSIRFDQNIVVVYPCSKCKDNRKAYDLCDKNFHYKVGDKNARRIHQERSYYDNFTYVNRNYQMMKTEYEKNYYRTSERFMNLTRNKSYKTNGSILPLFNSGVTQYNYSRKFIMVNVTKYVTLQTFQKWNNVIVDGSDKKISIIQFFKVRKNSTLYAKFLGVWDRVHLMSAVEVPYPVEARDFLGEEMIIGRCNYTGDGVPSLDDDGPAAVPMLDDILDFIAVRLKTTSLTRYYSKLGFRTYEGTWTGLLGALMENSVDLALEPVTAHASRHQDMDFIFPIAETMCNIYIRQQETSTVRDIFLAPFSGSLIACVMAVAVTAAMVVTLISRTSSPRDSNRKMGYTEALIWATGILCQQGGTWTPSNPAGSVLLIVCLLFAVVTYNAYAAFITSVLSVRVASVDTIAAVLHSPDFKIGYIRNGADQMYLMSTKDVQLNAFYIRGYSDADNLVSSAEEGLARAARQDYAFFAGQRVARSTLRSLSQARGRCAVRELPVHSTRAHLAFPLPRRSPYARPTLLTLLQLRSGGALARLEAALVPDMPQCAPPPGFASARATDVRSALILLIIGLISAFLIGLGEYCWKNRKELQKFVIGCYRRFLNLVL